MTSEDLHENRQAITDLFFAYAWHFDRSELDLGAALFTDDATIDTSALEVLVAGVIARTVITRKSFAPAEVDVPAVLIAEAAGHAVS